jgi:predicted lipid-binding transport protein (Tim44 family)
MSHTFHIAAAGGGSSGFGGGYHGGGRGAGLYVLFQILIRLLIFGHGLGVLIVIGLIVLAALFLYGGPRAERFWSARRSAGHGARRRVATRQRRVELAAAEAAEEDPAFASDVVRTRAATLFKEIQRAWDAADRDALRRLVSAPLLREWERRLDDFARRGWRNRVKPLGDPTVEYVGLTHTGDASDHVVVRIEAKLRDYVEDRWGNRVKRAGRLSEVVRVREFWTLIRDGQRWILGSIEQGAEGAHALEEPIVATPWSDESKLRDEALVERAVADAVPAGTSIADLADLDFDGEARAAALDLSLADGRFAPDVLEVAARRTVAAWAQAVDGDERGLLALARPAAARALLYPAGEDTRLVVRGPEVRRIRISALDAAAAPASMTIEVEINGRRYLEDRDTAAVVEGDPVRARTFVERWVLTLDGDEDQPWRLAAVVDPLARM